MENLSYDDLIDYATEVITEIRRRAYGEGYEQGKFDQRMDSAFNDVAEITNGIGINVGETEQERRDRIVDRAKEDVKTLRKCPVTMEGRLVEFVVNKDKRTVVSLLKSGWRSSHGVVSARGIAKCAHGDCFNVHIGKAIALRRAIDREVPVEYLNAPQPTEVRVGDIVNLNGVTEMEVFQPAIKTVQRRINSGVDKIIDDSRE